MVCCCWNENTKNGNQNFPKFAVKGSPTLFLFPFDTIDDTTVRLGKTDFFSDGHFFGTRSFWTTLIGEKKNISVHSRRSSLWNSVSVIFIVRDLKEFCVPKKCPQIWLTFLRYRGTSGLTFQQVKTGDEARTIRIRNTLTHQLLSPRTCFSIQTSRQWNKVSVFDCPMQLMQWFSRTTKNICSNPSNISWKRRNGHEQKTWNMIPSSSPSRHRIDILKLLYPTNYPHISLLIDGQIFFLGTLREKKICFAQTNSKGSLLDISPADIWPDPREQTRTWTRILDSEAQ